MTVPLKPMLLERKNPLISRLEYPYYLTPKLDGIRCLVGEGGKPFSRTLKQIPNLHVQKVFQENPYLYGADGELIMGPPNSPTVYRETFSAVMGVKGEPDFSYHIFDIWRPAPFRFGERYRNLNLWRLPSFAKLVPVHVVNGPNEVLLLQERYLDEGYEGVILRNPNGAYKHGRTTMNEQNSYKLKTFEDDEATIIGYKAEMENTNEATINETGNTSRSIDREGLIAKESLGAILVENAQWGPFWIGSGWTKEERRTWWLARETLKGRVVKYKYFPIGIKDKPRHPIFMGFRDMEIDG